MPEAPLTREEAGAIPDVDALFRQTHDEYVRTRFATVLLDHAMMNLRYAVWGEYDAAVRPAFEKAHGRAPADGHEIGEALRSNTFFRTYSSIRYNAQEMIPQSVRPAVERAGPEMNAAVTAAIRANATAGTLRLKPDMIYPRYMTAVDAHLTPGGYYSEYTDNDVTQAMLLQGRRIAGQPSTPSRNFFGVGRSVATWLSRRFPDLKPRRVLDHATQEGKNLFAYSDVFPGIELHGADIAAPSLRYGHAQAIRKGVVVHFSQQNAEQTDFPDGMFDLVVSCFFLHETSLEATKKILKECHRILAPGGVMAHMELPPHKSCPAIQNFTFDWDTKYNNEPYYANFRSQDPTELCVEAGFARENTFEITVPDVGMCPPDLYEKFLRGEYQAPPHGRGGWFVFGARK